MKRLPDTELELMMIIWNADGPITRMEIEEHMDKDRKILCNSVLSFLSRLEKKGFVKREKSERTVSKRNRKEFFEENVSGFAGKFCGSSI